MTEAKIIHALDLKTLPRGRHHLWFRAVETGLGTPLDLPVIVLKGAAGPCIFLQAALHGDVGFDVQSLALAP